MLPRVSAAISQFIKPIDSSRETATQREGARSKPDQRGKPKLAAVPKRAEAGEASRPQPGASLPAKKNEPVRALNNVAEALVQLLVSLAKHRATFMKWLGPKAYREAGIARKKATNFRKGSMLDVKVE